MRKVFLSVIFTLSLTISLSATVQTPPINASFTCNLTPAKCSEFLRLVSTGMGWTADSPLTKQQFVEKKVVNVLIQLGRQQKLFEASEAAKVTAETSYNSDFPDQP